MNASSCRTLTDLLKRGRTKNSLCGSSEGRCPWGSLNTNRFLPMSSVVTTYVLNVPVRWPNSQVKYHMVFCLDEGKYTLLFPSITVDCPLENSCNCNCPFVFGSTDGRFSIGLRKPYRSIFLRIREFFLETSVSFLFHGKRHEDIIPPEQRNDKCGYEKQNHRRVIW